MKKAGDFLSRFNKLTPPNDALRTAVVRAINGVLDVKLSKTQVSIRSGVAYIECPSVLKHAITLRRHDILNDLFERMPKARDLVRTIR